MAKIHAAHVHYVRKQVILGSHTKQSKHSLYLMYNFKECSYLVRYIDCFCGQCKKNEKPRMIHTNLNFYHHVFQLVRRMMLSNVEIVVDSVAAPASNILRAGEVKHFLGGGGVMEQNPQKVIGFQ